jgi:hypothetical protein
MFKNRACMFISTLVGTHKKHSFFRVSVIKMESSSEDDDYDGPIRKAPRYKETTAADRQTIFMAVRSTMVEGKVKRGIFMELGKQLGFKPATVSRQWRSMSQRLPALLGNHPVEEHPQIIKESHHILFATGQSSRKKAKWKYDRVALDQHIKDNIAKKKRRTTRHLAGCLGIPLSTCHYLLKPRPKPRPRDNNEDDGIILRRATSKFKPTLKYEHKIWRFIFASAQIDPATVGLRVPKFRDMMDRVHIDEKWFWLCKDGEK